MIQTDMGSVKQKYEIKVRTGKTLPFSKYIFDMEL